MAAQRWRWRQCSAGQPRLHALALAGSHSEDRCLPDGRAWLAAESRRQLDVGQAVRLSFSVLFLSLSLSLSLSRSLTLYLRRRFGQRQEGREVGIEVLTLRQLNAHSFGVSQSAVSSQSSMSTPRARIHGVSATRGSDGEGTADFHCSGYAA